MRFFNTAGPVMCDDHYCLPPLERFNLEDILQLIGQKKYFVLHAPRQTGKTSCLLALMDYINADGRYKCLYMNVEPAQGAREDVFDGVQAILGEMATNVEDYLGDESMHEICEELLTRKGKNFALNAAIRQFCVMSEVPVILLIDEIDSLVGDTLISVLRQLRAGYSKRPAMFPQSVVLCGVRDVRDYRIYSSSRKEIITGGSAFNIKAKSLRLGDFSRAEVQKLYDRYTLDTGRPFEPSAMELIWRCTEGQPWLVNALGYELCFEIKEYRDTTIPITEAMVKLAKENLILRRDTHLDQLTDKLQEERVRRVIGPILAGDEKFRNVKTDDISYVQDLGLIKTSPGVRVSNGIYMEVIPRELTWPTQVGLSHETEWYVDGSGMLDMCELLTAFGKFFRKHSESWAERFQYKEAGPQLLMQAFLQRVVNGGGTVEREYGLGMMRTDLLVTWPHDAGVQETVIELKIRHGSLEKTIARGLEQTWKYMDKCGTGDGHLVIFDGSEKKAWDEKIFYRQESHMGLKISVWGM